MTNDQIPFERYRNGHVITVPVMVGDSVPTRFVLDTGIGVNLISTVLAQRLGYLPTGASASGKRMSGQDVSTPLTRIASLSLGSVRKENVVAGMLDMAAFFPKGSGIDGFLSPRFFEPWPFAINSLTRTVRVEREPPRTFRPGLEVEVPIRVVRDGPAVTFFVDLRLPSDTRISVEVDTGSDQLILHSRFMNELGVNPDRPDVRKVEGTDETGHSYTRYFAPVRGEVRMAEAPSILQRDPAVMFQKIIYDGLVGDAFLRSYDVTYDLAGARMILADPSA